MNSQALIRLFQLVSPALPVGAYAYSTGLEQAIELGWTNDEASVESWIDGVFRHSLCKLDIPVMQRLMNAFAENDVSQIQFWSDYLFNSRESAELQMEDAHLGTALARLATDLQIEGAALLKSQDDVPFATVYALICHRWKIPVHEAALGYGFMWIENQVAAAIKLIPLGQTAGQRILLHTGETLPNLVEQALTLPDDELGSFLPGVALASAMHETQYSRLFRS